MNSSHARYRPQEPDQGAAPNGAGTASRPSAKGVADPTPVSATSPARILQDQLSAGLYDQSDEKKWPRGGTVLFVVATCGAFWGAVYWAVSALMRR
jgi:hypothetical protein